MLLLLLERHFVTPHARTSFAALFIPAELCGKRLLQFSTVCDKLILDVDPSQTGETAALENFYLGTN